MENNVFYDIEEGEILDGDMDSPDNLDNEYPPLSSYWEKVSDVKDSIVKFHGSKGFTNERQLKAKPYDQKWSHPMLPQRDIVPNFNMSLIGDYKLEPARSQVFITSSNSYQLAYHKGNLSEKHNGEYLGVPDGMAEDIMSQIDQVVCRKKNSDHRVKKSKDYKHRWEVPYERKKFLYDMRIERKSGIKRKKRHDKCKVCSHDLSPEKLYDEDSTRRKRLNHKKSNLKTDFSSCYYDENTKTNITDNPNKHLRDFDQVRKDLLEKLQKQKLEKSHPTDTLGTTQTICMESSKCENSATKAVETNNLHPLDSSQSEPDEEMDLAHLRLIALTSNRKKKPADVEDLNETEKSAGDIDFFPTLEPEPIQTPQPSEKPLDDSDIDRNELLLRAEALKTALLKKHQKRLDKATRSNIVKSQVVDGSESVAQVRDSGHVTLEEATEVVFLADKSETNTLVTLVDDAPPGPYKDNLQQETSVDEGSSPQKRCAKNGINSKSKKRKKRPSVNLSHVKENESQECLHGGKEGGPIEEDCQHLRSQLLCDLIRRKSSPKSPKSKSVLLDSMQKPASNPVVKSGDKVVNIANVKPYLKATKSSTIVNNSGRSGKLTTAPAVPKAEIQRVIVHLGSDDSSDDDLDEESPKKEAGNSFASGEKEPEANEIRAEGTNIADQDFGDNCKKVMLLLGETRKQVEEQQKARESKLATTEAIYKHLPLSQRLEYFRLKQKIAERERERRRMKSRVAAKSAYGSATAQSLPQKPLPATKPTASIPADPSQRLNKAATNASLGSPNSHPDPETTPRPAPTAQTVPTRLPSNQTLISKLKFLLKKVKIEKTIEENYEKEIAKLKGQLMVFEKRKSEQRFKIKRLVEESVKTYNQIAPLATAKPTVPVSGSRRKKPELETPTAATNPAATTDLRKGPHDANVEVNGGDAPSQISKAGVEKPSEVEGIGLWDQQHRQISTTAADDLIRYSSPLEAFTLGSAAAVERLDPNAIMCQFDIAGVCRDEDCAYQHCNTKL